MPGLIDSTDGLRYGTGLIFEQGLGGAGLINPPSGVPSNGYVTEDGLNFYVTEDGSKFYVTET